MGRVTPQPGERVAVVGGGVSGLVTAYLLRERFDVTVFEAGAYAGGHTNTIDVETTDGPLAVDTGFIVYNEKNYPLFTKLLAELGVETQSSTMSFGVSCERTGVEYNGSSFNQLFAQRKNLVSPRFHRMVRDILRFNREAESLAAGADDSMTVGRYVRDNGFSEAFAELYLVPIGSSIWSCPAGTFRAFPVRFVIEFLRNHGMLQVGGRPEWRVIRGGSRRYVEKLTAGFADRIRLNAPVRRVWRVDGGVDLALAGGGAERFDHVVFACHADQALGMLDDPTGAERELLGSFPYETNETVLHTDTSVLPSRRRAWGSWNYRVRGDREGSVAITYNMNMLQSLDTAETYCVTLNDSDRIDPARVIRRLTYHHPIYTTRRDSAHRRHGEVICANRTSFCGAYWGYGFHEDGVRSAVDVARGFGVDW